METCTVNTVLLVCMIDVLIISFPQIYGLLVNTINLNLTGIVADMDVEVFRDQAGTEALTAIDWGECSLGAGTTQTL